MSKLQLTFACGPYDRTLAMRDGTVAPEGIEYGIEANRPSLEALLQYAHEHGLTDRRLKVEELFAPSTLRDIPLSEGQHV
jgi:hypothetical protein